MKKIKYFALAILAVVIVICGVVAWILFGSKTSNPENCSCVGEISTPWGYERINKDDGFAQYLRELPLKERGSKVEYYTGGEARLQSINYAVVDLPMLSNDEQCADVCMRLRAEYLYNNGKPISFKDVNGNTLRFCSGSRKSFERYLRKVYGVASTFSLKRDMKHRDLEDIQPGDVFVYAAGDHDLERKVNSKYGHAIMVVDVAQNKDGKRTFLLAEGNTPARNIHLLRNLQNPWNSPWFTLDEDAESFILSVFYYKKNELRRF